MKKVSLAVGIFIMFVSTMQSVFATMKWVGTKEVAFILAKVNHSMVDQPPANWENDARKEIFFNPDSTGFDRSFRAYIRSVSFGKARLGGEIFGPYDVPPKTYSDGKIHLGDTMAEAIRIAGDPNKHDLSQENMAIRARQGLTHGFTHICVIFPHNSSNDGSIAWMNWPSQGYGNNAYYQNSNIYASCLIRMPDFLGIAVMENLHMLTEFLDLYGRPESPGDFDVMDCACGTHPSSFTKIQLGWIEGNDILTVGSQDIEVTLQDLALPPQSGRYHTLKIPLRISSGYFLVEARLGGDPFDAGIPGTSKGIPGSGLVVYWIDEGIWPPVSLKTRNALQVGQKFTDTGEELEITIVSQVPNGINVKITKTFSKECELIKQELNEITQEIMMLQEILKTATPSEKKDIIQKISRLRSKHYTLKSRAWHLGCP